MPQNHTSFLKGLFGDNTEGAHKRIFHSMKAKADAKRKPVEKLADWMTSRFGSPRFLWFNIIVFASWLLINTGHIKGVPIFDPFPFSLLTTAVSLEAIMLAIFVLISQNRTTKLDDLREETHLQLNLISEKEITKIIKMMALLLEKQGIDISQDPELRKMLRPFNENDIEKMLEKEIH
ncbi:MAG: DUF1003 domain-containing protein [bacterium]|nr:DUF1003 domain-containing protein [bacterium]